MKKDYNKRYKVISQSEAFKKIYENQSLEPNPPEAKVNEEEMKDKIIEIFENHELLRTDGVHQVMIKGIFPEVYKPLATEIHKLYTEPAPDKWVKVEKTIRDILYEMVEEVDYFGKLKETGNHEGHYKDIYKGKYESYSRCQLLLERMIRWHSLDIPLSTNRKQKDLYL